MSLARSKVFSYFSLFMSLIYIAIGVYIYANKIMASQSVTLNNVFALIVIMYGLFRLYKAIMILKNLKNEEV